jgi:hypothetical protein
MRRPTRRAAAFIFALLAVFVLGIVIFSMVAMASDQSRATRRYELRQEEFAAAETALNKAYAELRHFLEYGVPDLDAAVASVQAPGIPGIEFPTFRIDQTFAGNELQDSGPFVGLTLYARHYRVTAQAHRTGPASSVLEHPGVLLTQDLELKYVPLYIYGIFYDADLEILPGPPFIETGRVHTNANLYVGSGDSASFYNYVTAHGDIHHGLHPLDRNHSTMPGSVKYFDGTDLVSDLLPDGSLLDHDHPQWADLAQSTWNGRVRDSSSGMPDLPLPIPPTDSPHVVIEPSNPDDTVSVAEAKFDNKADLVIEVDPSTHAVTAHDAQGNAVDLTYDPPGPPGPVPIYQISTFHDNREGRDVTTIDIDMGLLGQSGHDPANGIVYVNSESGVRLVNGATLPTNLTEGFTVATNGPLYVQGDYNTLNTKLSLLAADSVNILSNGWDDANSSLSLSNRHATPTELRSVVMAGNVPTGPDVPYSGGVENYFRFHEDWTNVTSTFRGSIICLWASEIQTAPWFYGDPVYTAPNRDWNWDVIYGGLNGPPGTPRVFFVERLEWNATG